MAVAKSKELGFDFSRQYFRKKNNLLHEFFNEHWLIEDMTES
jgi:hypothetical protein